MLFRSTHSDSSSSSSDYLIRGWINYALSKQKQTSPVTQPKLSATVYCLQVVLFPAFSKDATRKMVVYVAQDGLARLVIFSFSKEKRLVIFSKYDMIRKRKSRAV